MLQSKLTNRSSWGQITSINNTSAPGFIPIPCPTHHEYSITNICKTPNCIEPLCPQCISSHIQLHQQSKKPAKIQNIITTRMTCIQQLAKMKYQAQQSIQQYISTSNNNIDEFIKSHQKKLDIAYKKIIKIVDDLFIDLNKQMQIIANAYNSQKQKKIKQTKIKLTPIQQFFYKVSQYKQQLQSDDYIPALIELLNQPPKQPKSEPLSQTQNYGSVEINQKYLQDIKNDINKFVKVVVNCKDQNFKQKLQMTINKSHISGSNNMKFSRFDRSRSRQGRDGSESKILDLQHSNSKKKVFGCESVISDIKPITGSNSKIQFNNNSIYHQNNINKKRSQSSFNYHQQKIQNIKYVNSVTPIKITKSSYFYNSSSALWYFKEGTKNAFKASLNLIQTGFEKVQLATNFLIPDQHRTIIAPNGDVYLIGGQNKKDQTTTNKVFKLNDQQLTLRELQPMHFPRSNFGACHFQDCIYVAGGLFSQSNKWINPKPTNSLQKYRIKQNHWQQLSPLPQPSFDFSMSAMHSGKIIKLGGMSESRVFMNKIDIYSIYDNSWSSYQPDNRFIFTWGPGITQISSESLIIFGGRVPSNNQKISKCYVVTEEENGNILAISQGPQLYNGATFQSAFIHQGSVIAIQNNQTANRNKLIMGYKYQQWKFVAC